jgi:hypothetical protein
VVVQNAFYFSGNIVDLGLYQAVIVLGWLDSQPIVQGVSSIVNYDVVVLPLLVILVGTLSDYLPNARSTRVTSIFC